MLSFLSMYKREDRFTFQQTHVSETLKKVIVKHKTKFSKNVINIHTAI